MLKAFGYVTRGVEEREREREIERERERERERESSKRMDLRDGRVLRWFST